MRGGVAPLQLGEGGAVGGEGVDARPIEPAQLVEHCGERAHNLVHRGGVGDVRRRQVLLQAVALGELLDAVARLQPVRGRLERAVIAPSGAPVYVDYAHTPDAVATAIKALRPHVMGRLIAIVGAGGDRDAGKRPLMGRAAAENADLVIVTDDNPRSEDPAAIRAQVLEGAPEATEVGDRAEAILRGVDLLQPGDALLVCGKGHETGQIVGDTVYPFDDVEQASVAVAALDGRGL